MRKKGFTLIELLGVIVILALLMIIVMPKIINSLKSSNEKIDDLTLKMIYNAAELYVSEYENNFQTNNGNSYCITLKDLTGEGYLKSPINVNDTDITNLKSVQATYNDGFTYELKNNDECEVTLTTICTAVTSGKSGSTEIGTKYKCYVNNVENYDFYVLSTNTDGSVNLLMSENINDEKVYYGYFSYNGKPASSDYYDAIVTDIPQTQIVSLTSSWSNIIGTARLPEYEELAGNVCTKRVEKAEEVYGYEALYYGGLPSDYYYGKCADWAIGNYWTSKGDAYDAWAMNDTWNTLDAFSSEYEYKFGIRPVITVPSSKLG